MTSQALTHYTMQARIAELEAALQAVVDAHTLYERYGEICPFEGQPMIYASTLIGLAEIATTVLAASKEKP